MVTTVLLMSVLQAMSVLQQAGVSVGSDSGVGGRLAPPIGPAVGGPVYTGHKRSSYDDFDDRRKSSRFS